MKLIAFVLLGFVAFAVAQRQERDIGLHLSGGHHHDHHHDSSAVETAASSRVSQGYGNDAPKIAAASSVSTKQASAGYPRENPVNPLKLDGQAATNVEVKQKVESNVGKQAETTTQAMMMGGEIPGNAGTDYPIFDTVPETKFDCKEQATGGYYADVDEGLCQVFHICHDGRKFSFLCPNGTLFDQKVFVCNWYFNVDCAASKDFYNLNAQIGVVPEKTESSSVADLKTTNTAAKKTNGVSASASASSSSGQLAAAASISDSQKVAGPVQQYLPPSQEQQAASYVPPTASEALTNGIITPAKTAPAQSYLPPDENKPEQTYLPPDNKPAASQVKAGGYGGY